MLFAIIKMIILVRCVVLVVVVVVVIILLVVAIINVVVIIVDSVAFMHFKNAIVLRISKLRRLYKR